MKKQMKKFMTILLSLVIVFTSTIPSEMVLADEYTQNSYKHSDMFVRETEPKTSTIDGCYFTYEYGADGVYQPMNSAQWCGWANDYAWSSSDSAFIYPAIASWFVGADTGKDGVICFHSARSGEVTVSASNVNASGTEAQKLMVVQKRGQDYYPIYPTLGKFEWKDVTSEGFELSVKTTLKAEDEILVIARCANQIISINPEVTFNGNEGTDISDAVFVEWDNVPGVYSEVDKTQGFTFSADNVYKTSGGFTGVPYTVSTWLCLPEGRTERSGMICGNFKVMNSACMIFEVYANGVPRIYGLGGTGNSIDLLFNDINVCKGKWTCLTFTIDMEQQLAMCYVNGVLKQTLSIPYYFTQAYNMDYCLGSDLRAGNSQYFKGNILELALYDKALTSDEVYQLYTTGSVETDLIACYQSVDGTQGEIIPDVTGNGNDMALEFFSNKEEVTDYAYSFAVVGDTQVVTYNDVTNNTDDLSKIYQWIIENQQEKKIEYVLGLGDVTDQNMEAEWAQAKKAIGLLDENQIPYSIIRGNHDLPGLYGDTSDLTDYFTNYLGTEYYKGQFDGVNGGFYEESNIFNSWRTLEVGSMKYLILALDYGPSDAVLEWAGQIIAQHPEHKVIITTHAYLYTDGTTVDAGDYCPPTIQGRENNGVDIWNELASRYENVILVLSGHEPSENIIVSHDKGANGNVVTSMLIDPQYVDAEKGSTGMITMLYFSEDGTEIAVETYSTVREKYFKQENQFNLTLGQETVVTKGYSADEFATYRTGEQYTAPTYPRFFFAGWYWDEACQNPIGQDVRTVDRKVYAKFIPTSVLDVKAQISTNLTDSDSTNDSEGDMRFVTSIDTLKYNNIGFELSYKKMLPSVISLNDSFDDEPTYNWEVANEAVVELITDESKVPTGGSGNALYVKCNGTYAGFNLVPISEELQVGREYTISFDMKTLNVPEGSALYVRCGDSENYQLITPTDGMDQRVEVTLEAQENLIRVFGGWTTGLEFSLDNLSIETHDHFDENFDDEAVCNWTAANGATVELTADESKVPAGGSGQALYVNCGGSYGTYAGVNFVPISEELQIGRKYTISFDMQVLNAPSGSKLYIRCSSDSNAYQLITPTAGMDQRVEVTLEAQENLIRVYTGWTPGLEFTLDNISIVPHYDVTLKKTVAANAKVYSTLYAKVNDASSGIKQYKPYEEFCNLSNYFKTYTVTNIPQASFDTAFTVTPFIITKDGTKVEGYPVTKTVNQGIEAEQ